jgi:hypothetical protein
MACYRDSFTFTLHHISGLNTSGHNSGIPVYLQVILVQFNASSSPHMRGTTREADISGQKLKIVDGSYTNRKSTTVANEM